MAAIELSDLAETPASSGAISLSDLAEPPAPVDKGPRYQAPPLPSTNLGRVIGEAGTAVGGLLKAEARDPIEASKGIVKGAVGGAISLAELAPKGLAAIGDMVAEWFGGKPGVGTKEMETLLSRAHQAGAAITHINTVPKGQDQEAFGQLLSILPNAAKALGEDVQEMFGSASLATAAEVGGNALMLISPEKSVGAVKPLRESVVKGKAEKPVEVQQSTAFDELAANDPEAAKEFADHVAKADPEFGDKLHTRAAEVADKPAEVVGRDIAKAKIKVKPEQMKFREVTPEQVGGSIREAVASGYKGMDKVAAMPAEPLSKDLQFSHAIRQEYSDARYHPEMQKVFNRFASIRDTERADSGHAVLDSMIAASPKDSYTKDMLEHLRKRMPDVNIKIEKTITDDRGKPQSGYAGFYNDATKTIHLALGDNPPGPWHFQVLAHEMVHAATLDFMIKYPNHPLVKDLQILQLEAWNQLKELEKEAKANGVDLKGSLSAEKGDMREARGTMYGVSHIAEMMSEIKSNPAFIELLSRASKFKSMLDGLKTGFNKLADKIADILQLPKTGRRMIREIMAATDRFMDAAAMDRTKEALVQMRNRPSRTAAMPAEDPTLYMDEGKPVKKSAVDRAFTYATDNPATNLAKGKLAEYFDWVVRIVNPEALGPAAKDAAAILAHNIADQMQRDTWNSTRSKDRRTFWNHRPEEAADFISRYEKGEKFDDATVQKAATAYKNWNTRIALEDAVDGFEYEPVDNYLYHTFEDGDKVSQFFERRYGTKWGDPGFIKQRVYSLYEEATAAGFKPKYTNPEDIMLARQHASDVARMKVQTFHDLEQWGLAVRAEKGVDPPYPATRWRSPTGESYWVHNDAHAVLHNAWETKSMWTMKGPPGDLFRGAMWLKNAIVPIKLGFSLFHPLHVATIDNATGMVRATKSMMGGNTNPAAWVAKMIGSAAYKDFFSSPIMGGRLLNAYKGKIKDAKMTDTDRIQLQYMAEGGLIPTMSEQFRNNAMKKFKDSWQQGSAKAVFKAPFAALEWVQGLMFDKWIPSLKIASYVKDVKTLLENRPDLVHDQQKRLVEFRKLSKSVDNRYGEMAYNTLFWNRMVKDLAVANTLSLGWQMGFLREYGGGMMDLGQFAKGKGSVPQKIASGKMDRPLFVLYYTTQALAYGGLMTYAFTGKAPQSLWDYIFPLESEGVRLSTMFYTREFGSIYKHAQIEGVAAGAKSLIESKASGVVGLMTEVATGVNSWGEETRDPNGTLVQKVGQTLAAVLDDVTPISVGAMKKQSGGMGTTLSIAGFTPAPKYVTDTPAEAFIKHNYQKYSASRQTPYERVEQSADTQKLRKLYKEGTDEEYGAQVDAMSDKYGRATVRKLTHSLRKGSDPALKMFERLTWQQQKRAMDLMTPDERDKYIKHSNKEHLRHKYQAPEDEE